MSFGVYLACYQDGEPSGIEEGSLREAFGDALIREDAKFSYWHLEYGHEVNCCDVYFTRLESDNTRVKSLMVSRPLDEERLWTSLFRIMQLSNVVLYFPGGRSPLFASSQAVQHFPSDMLDALGEPGIVGSGAEILAAIVAG